MARSARRARARSRSRRWASSAELAVRLRALAELIRDAHLRANSDVARLPVVVEPPTRVTDRRRRRRRRRPDAGRRARSRSSSRAARAATGARRTARSSPTSSPRPPRCPPGADRARVAAGLHRRRDAPGGSARDPRARHSRARRSWRTPAAARPRASWTRCPTSALPRRGARVAIVCGKGGNGGDGFVVARWLKRAGHRVDVLLLARPDELRGDAAAKLARARQRGHPAADRRGHGACSRAALAGADLVVDALLGTGARGEPAPLHRAGHRGDQRQRTAGGRARHPVGAARRRRAAARARRCARRSRPTFAGLKRGLVARPGGGAGRPRRRGGHRRAGRRGRARRRRRSCSSPTTSRATFRRARARRTRGATAICSSWPARVGKTGAAALAARAAMRAGAGLVTVATAASAQPVVAASAPRGDERAAAGDRRRHDRAERPGRAARAGRASRRGGHRAGTRPATRTRRRWPARLVFECPRPMVVDADALTALAGHLDRLRGAPAARCLTPHPGEMARMLGVTRRRRPARSHRHRAPVRHRLHAHVVLKGATSVIGRSRRHRAAESHRQSGDGQRRHRRRAHRHARRVPGPRARRHARRSPPRSTCTGSPATWPPSVTGRSR